MDHVDAKHNADHLLEVQAVKVVVIQALVRGFLVRKDLPPRTFELAAAKKSSRKKREEKA
eukprot:g1144.t1